jgi:transposase
MSGRIARTHSREFKLTLCRQIDAGLKRPAQVCREHQLANSLLDRWRKEFQERGDQAFTPKSAQQLTDTALLEQRIAELERHCGQLSLENALLKKLASLLPSSSATP